MIALLISISFILLLVFWILLGISINKPSWKYYKPAYNSLRKEDFFKLIDQYWNDINPEYAIIWFKDGSIKVAQGQYIHHGHLFWLDPYTLYYYYKFTKWFNKNIDSNTPSIKDRIKIHTININ